MAKNIIIETLESRIKANARNLLDKSMLTLLCVVFYFAHIGFATDSPWQAHVLFSFCHANVFHLIINLWVLWQIQNRIPVVEALLVAFLTSYLPMYVSEPTMGLSGFLFAAFGIMWGKTGRVVEAFKAALPFIIITMFIGSVNGLLHLYAFILGLTFSYVLHRCFRF